MADEINIPFDYPKASANIIKVIGVGGGGSNAVNHMYREGIHDVTFVVCNTDNQALQNSPVPVKLQLGREGLGAGNKPENAKKAAEESIEDIKQMLDDGVCRMAFITAGMGGGTGTGAAPIVAKTAKEMDILTVGIVTIPFVFEGVKKIDQALDGVDEMSRHVDALLVINNERLRDVYNDLSVMNAFGKADDTLSIAAKSIAEIITLRGMINLDFNDVKTVLKDGGVAIMSTGYGEGEGRVMQAINDALHSPLLNNNDIYNSKKLLFVITHNPACELMMSEMDEIHEFMGRFGGREFDTKWGLYTDESLGDRVKFTILATGFGVKDVTEFERRFTKRNTKEAEEEEERQRALEMRRGEYYDATMLNASNKKHSHQIYIFTSDDLDNDDVISMIEAIPTYKRTKSVLENIRTRATSSDYQKTDADGGAGTATISF